MQAFRKRDEGFTLVELMVVVLIIGILVAVAIPVFNLAKANAQKKACFANQRTIEGAAQTFAADNDGTMPVQPANLVPNYIKVAPSCPAGAAGNVYTFTAASSGTVANCTNGSPEHGHY